MRHFSGVHMQLLDVILGVVRARYAISVESDQSPSRTANNASDHLRPSPTTASIRLG